MTPLRSHYPVFGRRLPRALVISAAPEPAIADEVRLFTLTFAGGFLFMMIYLA
ncbi:MAG: hypothetical protein M3Q57_01205 [Pseudomonadota bacterium]|nr:hypothetical protein [Pseudomonadota bacterium]